MVTAKQMYQQFRVSSHFWSKIKICEGGGRFVLDVNPLTAYGTS